MMALGATLIRFHIELADIDAGAYETIDARLAMHPSESAEYLAMRAIAYAILTPRGVELVPGGLSNGETPDLWLRDRDRITLWVDIGAIRRDRLAHGLRKAAEVLVFCHKDAAIAVDEIRSDPPNGVERATYHAIDPTFVHDAAATIERTTRWGLVVTGGELFLSAGDGENLRAELQTIALADS